MTKNPIPTGRTARVDNQGILDVLVKQVQDNQPYENETGCHLEEQFKGPYSKLKEVLSHIWVGQNISQIYTTLNAYVGISQCYRYPTCPQREGESGEWVCKSIAVDESEFGDHAFLNLSYDASYNNGDDPDELVDDPYQNVWTISWEAYSVDPYNFLKNIPNEPYPCSPSFDTDPSLDLPPDYWTQTGCRDRIDKYLNAMSFSKKVNDETYHVYIPNTNALDVRYFLNGAEAKVMEKKMLGRTATWHYPVIRHQTVSRGSVSANYAKTIGGSIDHIVGDSIQGCPYRFPSNTWTFVKTGDEVQQVKTRQGVSYTHIETFSGFRYGTVDMNFYGNMPFSHTEDGILSGRWEVESL